MKEPREKLVIMLMGFQRELDLKEIKFILAQMLKLETIISELELKTNQELLLSKSLLLVLFINKLEDLAQVALLPVHHQAQLSEDLD